MATRAWGISQALYAANLMSPDGSGVEVIEANRRAARDTSNQTRERLRNLDRLMGELGYLFARALEIVERTTGKITLKERVARSLQAIELEKDAIAEVAEALRQQMDALGIDIPDVAVLPAVPEIGRGPTDDDSGWRMVASLLINPDESLQVILHGRGVGGHHNASGAPSAILITDQRLLAFRKRELQAEGRLRVNAPIAPELEIKHATAYRDHQLRITLRKGRLGLVGGVDVDLEMAPDDVHAAIRLVEPILRGETVFAPQGPDFDQAIRRLDGGERWRRHAPLAISDSPQAGDVPTSDPQP